MARHVSDDSGASSDEGIGAVAPKHKQSKENRAPAFSLTAESEAPKPSKQQPGKRSKASSSTAKAVPAKTSKRTKSKAAREPSSEEEEQDGQEEVVEETQQDEMDLEEAKKPAGKKGAKGAAGGKKGKAEAVEENEGTPAERRLKAKLELTTKTLQQVQQAFEQLQELRTTKAEESEKQLTLIAAERQDASYNTIQLYKNENDELRAEIAELRANGHSTTSPRASSRPSAGDKTRVAQLEEKLAIVNEEKAGLAAEIEAFKAKEQGEERKKVQDRDSKWEKELARTIKAKDEEAAKALATLKMDLAKTTKDLSTANQELEAEIQHSKSLQAKLKNAPASSQTAAVGGGGSGSMALQKLTDELENTKMHLALNEDLTGFSVVSVKSEQMGEVYNCILNDCLGQTASLTFKLTFHQDETVSYQPDVDADRDAALVEVLPAELQKYMRFPAEACGEWFRKLFFRMNKLRV